MIHCNLSVLLAERRLKISRVAADTGISRTTLTALAYNNSMGIQMSTLNTLCIYLDIKPNQLFSFFPVDVVVEEIKGSLESLHVRFTVRDRWSVKTCVIYGAAEIRADGEQLKNVVLDLTKGASDFDEYSALVVALRDLPRAFRDDIEGMLFKKMGETVLEEYFSMGAKVETGFHVIFPSEQKEKAPASEN